MKNALIISDLYGINHKKHDHHYLFTIADLLCESGYQSQVISAPKLAAIKSPEQLTEQELHRQFISNNGLDHAVTQLTQSQHTYRLAIGFSIGGTILWQAALKNKHLFHQIICVSSTRLRHEKITPHCLTQAVFGTSDPYAPTTSQLKAFKIDYQFINNQNHHFYKNINNYRQHTIDLI